MASLKVSILEGLPHPLGATWDRKGVNFALFSAHASKVEVCLFDNKGEYEAERIELPEYTNEVRHGYIPQLGSGAIYAYRVYGAYEPQNGHRFNPNKLLLDPYARGHFGELKWNPAVFGYRMESGDDTTFDERDSAPFMPKCVVVDPNFEWTGRHGRRAVPWDRTIVYEIHVKGFTKRHPDRRSALDCLAERMGIEDEYRNAHGHVVHTSAATKRSLLAAMGVAAADEEQAQSALDSLDRSEWLRPLAPVQVLQADCRPAMVDLVLPDDTEQVVWRLVLENGTERSAQVSFDGLPLVGERQLDGRALQRRRLNLGVDLPCGYHRLSVEPNRANMSVVITPGHCWLPSALVDGDRMWGIAVQLYLLRSTANWGIGDFGDLQMLVRLASSQGADVIGLNPLHGMFSDDPEHASPYSPASRLLLNILNIDVTAVPELNSSAETRRLIDSKPFQEELQACRSQHLVDYLGVMRLKLKALEPLFEACRTAPDRTRWLAFEEFRQLHGEVLQRNCLFLALHEHFAMSGPAHTDWHEWPKEYRDPLSPAVAHFANDSRRRLEFLVWLQWIADEQLGKAAATARKHGMAVGLYRDLAVGADRTGAETWADAAAVVSGAQVGCPPDIYNPAGQNWGLPPFNPGALREEGYHSFIELVRANMRHAGGLRIDHVMALQHLYWVPEGQPPTAGAYVRYPMEDLIGILAIESRRHRCLIVGEDLGTVPDGFRERLAEANILSYRVLFFEQDAGTGSFKEPGAYPARALAVVGSHDLPTLRGWWEGRDIDLKERLGLFAGADEATRQREMRRRDQDQLIVALRREGLLAEGGAPNIPVLSRAAHAYLARTPSMLAMAQIDDLTDEADPVNVPTTSDEHPNWRRRQSMTLENLAERPRFLDIAEIFRGQRRSRKNRAARHV